jgi:hypothetical protein
MMKMAVDESMSWQIEKPDDPEGAIIGCDDYDSLVFPN